MYFQQRYLEESKTFESTSGLDIIDLPNKGLLSGIELRVWGTCGTGADKPDVWLHDRITKIELVVNGSKVVKSLTGDQLLADMLYKKTQLGPHDFKNMSAASCEEFFYINLGRHYHDVDYMLDLSKVTDPELRIEYDFTKTSQNGWTNGVAMSSAPYRSTICHLLRDAPFEPKGYIKTSELYRFTGGASKKENMLIPRGPVYSNLYVQSRYKDNGIGYNLDKLELNFNNDAIIPIRVGPTELASEIARMYGLFTVSQQFSAAGGQAYPFPIEQGKLVNTMIGLVDAMEAALDLWGASGVVPLRKTSDGVTPVTGNVNVNITCVGIWPFSVSAIPYFWPWDERTWVDSSLLGDFWVRYEGNASMSSNVVVKLLGDEVVTKYE
ncbi:MAG: hypothetical protein JRE40_14285 [Deltaproteobacteria bacterium]|nr:hypothetical protein [Deltaproteobacteria bacterium]